MSRPIGATGLGVSPTGTLLFMNEIRNPEWHGRALCRDRDPTLYELRDGDKTEEDVAQYKKTADECLDCPVFFTCLEDATKEDRRYMIRGGELPTGLRMRSRGRPRVREDVRQLKNGICNAGLHPIKSPEDMHGTNECRLCATERRRLSASMRTHCVNGHAMTEKNIGWKPKGDGTNRRFCRACARISAKRNKLARQERLKAAKIAA